MKTNTELRDTLNTILTRLDSDPNTAAEWATIESALADARAYAAKVERMQTYFEQRYGHPVNVISRAQVKGQ